MSKTGADWDRTYLEPGYAFGTEPNDFLVETAVHIPPGPVLCLGEGEGRNAVYLASLGHEVTAMDYSRVGLEKAQALAGERGVTIDTVCADLADYDMGVEAWSGIVAIFLQIPQDLRRSMHGRVAKALAPGGVFIAEAYGVQQAEMQSGGPRDAGLLYDVSVVKAELEGLQWEVARQLRRELDQGRRNRGLSAVCQLFARRPV